MEGNYIVGANLGPIDFYGEKGEKSAGEMGRGSGLTGLE